MITPENQPIRFETIRIFARGRPGSKQRRPTWEFCIEFDSFFFCSDNLVDVFRSSKLLPSFSNFNWFHPFYFCLGHVLGTRIVSSAILQAVRALLRGEGNEVASPFL
jgi:hypothetical protein